MRTVNRLTDLRRSVASLRETGTIALVPTMGALHDGHMALMRAAANQADHVVASIFVNPTQFGAHEDLDAYPRQLAEDTALLETEGVALLWAPGVEDIYPPGFATKIGVSGVSEGFCGAARPGHFDGVATIVCKLFNQVSPDVAVFGEKDWQQLAVIRRMARDLDLTRPLVDNIIALPTVREADGLAMSSRNRYLTPEQRIAASALPRAIHEAIAAIQGGTPPGDALGHMRQALHSAGFSQVDYATLADADSLAELDSLTPGQKARLLVAARIGGTRLIDNMPVG